MTHAAAILNGNKGTSSGESIQMSLQSSIRTALDKLVSQFADDGSHTPEDILRVLRTQSHLLLETEKVKEALIKNPIEEAFCGNNHDDEKEKSSPTKQQNETEEEKQHQQVVPKEQIERLCQLIHVTDCERVRTLSGYVLIQATIEIRADEKMKQRGGINSHIQLKFRYERDGFREDDGDDEDGIHYPLMTMGGEDDDDDDDGSSSSGGSGKKGPNNKQKATSGKHPKKKESDKGKDKVSQKLETTKLQTKKQDKDDKMDVEDDDDDDGSNDDDDGSRDVMIDAPDEYAPHPTKVNYTIEYSRDFANEAPQTLLWCQIFATDPTPSPLGAKNLAEEEGGDEEVDGWEDDDDESDEESEPKQEAKRARKGEKMSPAAKSKQSDKQHHETTKKGKEEKKETLSKKSDKNKSESKKDETKEEDEKKQRNDRNDKVTDDEEEEEEGEDGDQQEGDDEDDDPRDRFYAGIDPDILTTFLDAAQLDFKGDDMAAFCLLMAFPFFEHEWDVPGFVLDACMGGGAGGGDIEEWSDEDDDDD